MEDFFERFEKAAGTDGSIHSIRELRDSIMGLENIEILKEGIEDGSLSKWLSAHYYEEMAEKVDEVRSEDENWLSMLSKAMRIPYNPLNRKIYREDDEYIKRRNKVAALAGDDLEKLPDNVNLVALDQEELARLLDAKETTIYLCGGEFNIPLGKKGITYKGIAHPVIENAFTEELYRKAGIHIQDIDLPIKVDLDREKYALEKAIENGYDTFYESHCPLSCKFYHAVNGISYYRYCNLPSCDIAMYDAFHSKSSAKKAIRESIAKT